MLKYSATTLLFSLIFLSTITAQDWISSSGAVTTNTLNDVQFVSSQTAYAVGDLGTVIKSTDGGNTWTDVSFGETKSYLSLHFFDENIGFVGGPFSSSGGGSTEMLAKTTDGGQTWDILSSFDFEDFHDMEFLNADTGWVAAQDGKIIYTTDGGSNWSSKSAGTEDLLDMDLVNDSTFWVAGENGALYSSNDAGDSWDQAIQIDTLGLSQNDHLYGVEFTSQDTGYVTGWTYDSQSFQDVGFLLQTTDGGTTWEKSDYDFQHLLYDLEIGNNGEIVLAGGKEQFGENESNAIYISEDKGETWRVISDGDGPLFWTSLDSHSENWIATGESGATATFTLADDTLHTDIITGLDIADISFGDSDHGVFVTGRDKVQARIFSTTDGGTTWEERLKLDGRKEFNSVGFAGGQYVWAIGTDHYTGDSRWLIYLSLDKGETWTELALDFPVHEQLNYMEKVQFLDIENGFIKIEDVLLRTTDSGATWEKTVEPTSLSFTDFHTIHFLDSQNGWMAGDDHIVFTSDGGTTWETKFQQDNQSTEIIEIFALNNSTVYVSMQHGKLMKTTDAGDTWSDLNPSTSYDLNDLHFIDENSGYVVGDGGRILTTADGGQNFTASYDQTDKNIHSIFVLDENTSWIAGERGALLTTTNGGGIATSVEEISQKDIPSTITLDQNYPNPFNPSTVINFEIPQNSRVKLEVFDMMGRKVRTLLNGKIRSAGQHSVTFNANDLASGIYIYRLTAGTHVLTRKLTLIK
jgi:photosystem II stability/assembly factor-like uncharacterized protein